MIFFTRLFKLKWPRCLKVTVTRGTIGGIVIQQNNITSANGLFSVSSDGVLNATQANISGNINAISGTVGGFSIANGYMQGVNGDSMGGRFVLSPSGGYIAFVNDSTGSFAGIGSNVVSAAAGVKVLGRFSNVESNAGGTNVGIIAEAKNAGTNIAIDIPNGGIRVAGTRGFTGYLAVAGGNNQFDKYREGVCLGRGTGAW